jgi:hypothetical protein
MFFHLHGLLWNILQKLSRSKKMRHMVGGRISDEFTPPPPTPTIISKASLSSAAREKWGATIEGVSRSGDVWVLLCNWDF